jgi:hypothetical protein
VSAIVEDHGDLGQLVVVGYCGEQERGVVAVGAG